MESHLSVVHKHPTTAIPVLSISAAVGNHKAKQKSQRWLPQPAPSDKSITGFGVGATLEPFTKGGKRRTWPITQQSKPIFRRFDLSLGSLRRQWRDVNPGYLLYLRDLVRAW